MIAGVGVMRAAQVRRGDPFGKQSWTPDLKWIIEDPDLDVAAIALNSVTSSCARAIACRWRATGRRVRAEMGRSLEAEGGASRGADSVAALGIDRVRPVGS